MAEPTVACRFPAILNKDQAVGRPIQRPDSWTLGRAYVINQTWMAVFPKDGAEYRASLLLAPANFSILGGTRDRFGHGMPCKPKMPRGLHVVHAVH